MINIRVAIYLAIVSANGPFLTEERFGFGFPYQSRVYQKRGFVEPFPFTRRLRRHNQMPREERFPSLAQSFNAASDRDA
jgi:hypothetical protein